MQYPDNLDESKRVDLAILDFGYCRYDGQMRQRIIDPYGLVAKSTVWYLIGGVDDQMRIFRVSRMRMVKLVEERSQRPRDFDVRSCWEEWKEELAGRYTPYVVLLRVAPEGMQRLFERVDAMVRTSLRAEPTGDDEGWHLISMTFHSFLQAQTVAMSVGKFLEVVEPLELREAICAQAQQLVALYE